MSINHNYNKHLQGFANTNRKAMTKSEACLWKFVLSRRQMMGYQFRRQRPMGNYIADFACLPLGLVVEVDGLSHDNEIAHDKDKKRDKDLLALGFYTMRFSSWEVLNRIDDVSMMIRDWVETNAKYPPPAPRLRVK